MGRNQELKWLAFCLYPLSFFLYSPFIAFNLVIHIIVFYYQNISQIILWKWIPCQAVTSILCLLFRLKTVHCSTKNMYTSEITFLVKEYLSDAKLPRIQWPILNVSYRNEVPSANHVWSNGRAGHSRCISSISYSLQL